MSAGLGYGLQQGYSSPVEAAKLQGRGRSSRAVAAARRQQACHGWAATAGLQQQGCSSKVQQQICSSMAAATGLQQRGCVGVAAEGCSRGVAADGLLPGCSSWLGRGRRAVGAARARSLSSPPVEGEGGTRRRGPARLRIPGITWKDAGEMQSRLGEIESPARI